MKITTYRFRKTEEWKSALMLLPDSSFFELMRSIFGNIKTPFNKQKLLDELYILLSRDDVRNNISSYINYEDQKIMAAAALLEDPAPDELEEFFRGELSPLTLRALLANLEERLILYRFRDETRSSRRLALNPVLESVLAPLVAEPGILFPSEMFSGESSGIISIDNLPISDDRILASMFAFIFNREDLYKAPGIRKKTLEQWKQLFTGTDLEAAAGAFRQLGLFSMQGEKLIPAEKRISDYSALTSEARREYLASGFYFHLTESKNENSQETSGHHYSAVFPRNRQRRYAALIHRICSLLDTDRLYPETFFRRLLVLLEKEDVADLWRDRENIDFNFLMEAMEMAGILIKTRNLWKIHSPAKSEHTGPRIAMDSAFSIILYPGISFSDALDIASFSTIKDDNPLCFELSRESVIRCFNRGMTAEMIVKLLKQLSENRIEEGLEWTLKDWETRYAAVSLYEGVILNLSGERQYLAESEPVASLIRKTLKPGLYLLSGGKEEAAAALLKAGVDIIAQPVSNTELHEKLNPNRAFAGYEINRSFPQFRSFEEFDQRKILNDETRSLQESIRKTHTSSVQGGILNSDSKAIQEHFRKILKGLKLPKTEIDELLSRIDRKTIITETQLEKANIKYEKLEARGLDYQGKLTIAKQAISEGAMIEITWPSLPGQISTNEGIPIALEKKEKENILVVKSNNETLRIPLGKISVLKKHRQSIFRE
jgi:hypothetical protein